MKRSTAANGARFVALAALVLGLAAAPLFASGPVEPLEVPERAIYVINGALGDNAFYDSGQAGMERIAEEYGVEIRTIETNFDAGQYEPALRAAVSLADVIFVISYGFEDVLRDYADRYPDRIFVNLDTVVQNSANTITSVDFIEEEGAWLAGAVAALTTTSDLPGANAQRVIGAVGGDVDPVINAFIFAYTNGAQAIDPAVTVDTRFLGSWDDTGRGRQAAEQLYDAGADVVFQIAAAAGLGVLQAARARGRYAIGVDTNQNDIEPGFVVASNTKNVGQAIYEVYGSIRDGSYVPGEVLEYGLAEGGVDIVFEGQVQVLPASIRRRVLDLRQEIISGERTIERYTGN